MESMYFSRYSVFYVETVIQTRVISRAVATATTSLLYPEFYFWFYISLEMKLENLRVSTSKNN